MMLWHGVSFQLLGYPVVSFVGCLSSVTSKYWSSPQLILSSLFPWLWMAFTYLWFPTTFWPKSFLWSLYIHLSILYSWRCDTYFPLIYGKLNSWLLLFSQTCFSALFFIPISVTDKPSLSFTGQEFVPIVLPFHLPLFSKTYNSPSILYNPMHSLLISPRPYPGPNCESLLPGSLQQPPS